MVIPGMEHFKERARKETKPNQAAKELLKIKKKLGDIYKIEEKLRLNQKVDPL